MAMTFHQQPKLAYTRLGIGLYRKILEALSSVSRYMFASAHHMANSAWVGPASETRVIDFWLFLGVRLCT
jgi:hypothetical protein